MAKSLCVHVKDVGSIPGQGTKILHVADHSQKINKQTNKQKTLRSGLTMSVSIHLSHLLAAEDPSPLSC